MGRTERNLLKRLQHPQIWHGMSKERSIPVARRRLATGTPPLARANPPLATGTPLVVVFAEFALDKTALGREAAVTRQGSSLITFVFGFRPKNYFEYFSFADRILTGDLTLSIPSREIQPPPWPPTPATVMVHSLL